MKFQTFALVPGANDATELKTAVTAFTEKQMALLDQELMAGRRAVENFSPSEVSLLSQSGAPGENRQFVPDAFALYKSTRLDVQEQHFEGQARRHEERGRYPALFSEMAFVLGAGLAIIPIVAAAWNGAFLSENNLTASWLSFFTMGAFISSAVLAVYQRGSADAPNAERYRHYVREIRGIRMRIDPTSAESLFQTVRDMELTELRELFEFCRDSMRASYIF